MTEVEQDWESTSGAAMCKQYQLIFITFCRTKHFTFRVLKQKKIHYFQRSDGNEPHHPDYERRSGRQYAKLLEITICQNWSQAWIEKIYFLKSANAIKFSFVAYSRCLKAPPRQKTSREMWQNFEKRMMMLADNKSPPLLPPEILHKIFQVVQRGWRPFGKYILFRFCNMNF